MHRRLPAYFLSTALLALAAPFASAQGSYDCNAPLNGPDLIVGSINAICEWSSIGATSAYSIGATSCNVGDVAMQFSGNGIHHPVIAQNLYRYEDGRFVQLGQSWVKHGFASATEDLCCNCQNPGSSLMIGVGCADTYASCQNGGQGPINYQGNAVSGLGPRSDINPTTGAFAWPYTTFGQTGNTLYKRLQVQSADLNPSNHPNALYFAEVHYVGPDEGSVAKGHNNASYRRATVGSFDNSDQIWNLAVTGPTFQMDPAILAWQAQDPGVTINTVHDSANGRFYVASRATDNGNGTWRYEYAVYNMNSNLPANAVHVPVDSSVDLTSVGFRDVDSHSGEPYSTADWTSNSSSSSMSWNTGVGVNANAVRWGTMYNYWFTADVGPTTGSITLELLGTTDTLDADGVVPDGPSCGATSYCVSGQNSAGLNAAIGFSGSTSFAANDLTLTTIDAIPSSFGLFYYGQNQDQTAFGDGFRCVSGQTFRLGSPQSSDVFGASGLALDYDVAPMNAGSGMVSAGSSWNFQFWYRDTNGPSAFNLSDGLSVTFCP